MKIGIVAARLPQDARALARFDKRCFPNAHDHAEVTYFSHRYIRSFWLTVNGRRVGASSLVHHATIFKDPRYLYARSHGSLYILSTAIIPEEQGKGLGSLLKSWQIAYARRHGFTVIVTNARESNTASIALNQKHGFRVTGAPLPDFYGDHENAIVLSYALPHD